MMPNNNLIGAASSLLEIGLSLRSGSAHSSIDDIAASLGMGVRNFERELLSKEVAEDHRVAARYMLCTFLDEIANEIPWESKQSWSSHALLPHFADEPYGGERVFLLITRLMQSPSRHRAPLELAYLCLSLGMKGQNERSQLNALRERLAEILYGPRSMVIPLIGDEYKPVPKPQFGRSRDTTLWSVLCAKAFVCVSLFIGLSLWLSNRSDQAFATIRSIRVAPDAQQSDLNRVSAQSSNRESPPSVRALAQAAGEEIAQGFAVLRGSTEQTILTIATERVFHSGTDRLLPDANRMLEQISRALAPLQGSILVIAHTDDSTPRNLQFPSRWHLTQQQARIVSDQLNLRPIRARLSYEGRADREPLEAQRTANERLSNRRIEIIHFSSR